MLLQNFNNNKIFYSLHPYVIYRRFLDIEKSFKSMAESFKAYFYMFLFLLRYDIVDFHFPRKKLKGSQLIFF